MPTPDPRTGTPLAKLTLSPGLRTDRQMDGAGRGGGGRLLFLSTLTSLGNEAAGAAPPHNAPARCRIPQRGRKALRGEGTPQIRHRN